MSLVTTRRRTFSRTCLDLLALGLAFGAVPARVLGADAEREYRVKAGFVAALTQFIEWPAAALPAPDTPIVVGVLDHGEILSILEPLKERKIDRHPLQIKAVTPGGIGAGLHILFVARSVAQEPEAIRTALGGGPTLLMGDADQFAERGGMVGFVLVNDSFKLALNLEAIASAGLKISAKVNSVAIVVKPKRAP